MLASIWTLTIDKLVIFVLPFFQIVQSSISPLTCSTTAVKSNFKQGYHIFGQQEATFNDVDMQGDMVVIARFYLKRRQKEVSDFETDQVNGTLYDEETLVGWTAIPLVLCTESEYYVVYKTVLFSSNQ